MVEEGNNGPPRSRDRRGFDTSTITNFGQRSIEILQKRKEDRFSQAAENILNNVREALTVMDRKSDPVEIQESIRALTNILVNVSTELDHLTTSRYEDLAQREEPLEALPGAVPLGEFSSIPRAVYEYVGDAIRFANNFAALAAARHAAGEQPDKYRQDIKSAKDAAFAAVIALYDGMKTVSKRR